MPAPPLTDRRPEFGGARDMLALFQVGRTDTDARAGWVTCTSSRRSARTTSAMRRSRPARSAADAASAWPAARASRAFRSASLAAASALFQSRILRSSSWSSTRSSIRVPLSWDVRRPDVGPRTTPPTEAIRSGRSSCQLGKQEVQRLPESPRVSGGAAEPGRPTSPASAPGGLSISTPERSIPSAPNLNACRSQPA